MENKIKILTSMKQIGMNKKNNKKKRSGFQILFEKHLVLQKTNHSEILQN